MKNWIELHAFGRPVLVNMDKVYGIQGAKDGNDRKCSYLAYDAKWQQTYACDETLTEIKQLMEKL